MPQSSDARQETKPAADIHAPPVDSLSAAAEAAAETPISAAPTEPPKPSLLERLAQRGKDLAARAGWNTNAPADAADRAEQSGGTKASTADATTSAAQWDAFVADQKAGEASPLAPDPTAGEPCCLLHVFNT